jgi:hypothetical protein
MFVNGRRRRSIRSLTHSLETGNPHLVLAAARELPQVALDDALRVCLVLRDGDSDRYERAAVRLGRFVLESRGVTIAELRLAPDALDRLPDQRSEAMEQLQALCFTRGVR